MKIILSNPDKSLGLILPESNAIQEIGMFDTKLIKEQIKSLKSFKTFTDDSGCDVIKIAIINSGNSKQLAMKPADSEGEAWVVLAPRVKERDENGIK